VSIDKWPNDEQNCILFVTFISIYQEESQTFNWLFQYISTGGFKSPTSKHLLIKMIALVRRRESNFSLIVKRKKKDVQKLIHRSQLKFRNIWNLMIHGNNFFHGNIVISEALESIETTEKEFKHLFHQFPNNWYGYQLYQDLNLKFVVIKKNLKK
jgi:hypothetical protein